MLRILVVDDTRSVHAFLKGLIERASAKVEMVSVMNGREACNHLASDARFDAILLDWEMPEMDGPTTLGAIRKNGIGIPVIMATTKNSPEDIGKMLQAGANEYLMKPFTWDILAEKLETALGRRIRSAAV